jgi:hypothetical protein
MGPKGNLKKNDNPQFINPIGIYENHTRRTPAGLPMPPFTNAFKSWVRQHQITIDSAMQQSVFDMPGAVEALGEAADPRSRPILLHALNSPNVLVAFAAALGLARLQDDQAITAIIAAARRMWSAKERQTIAVFHEFRGAGVSRAFDR